MTSGKKKKLPKYGSGYTVQKPHRTAPKSPAKLDQRPVFRLRTPTLVSLLGKLANENTGRSCPSTAAWYRWDFPIPKPLIGCNACHHMQTHTNTILSCSQSENLRLTIFRGGVILTAQQNHRLSNGGCAKPHGERESCQNHERYRHCNCGGFTPGENRPLGKPEKAV